MTTIYGTAGNDFVISAVSNRTYDGQGGHDTINTAGATGVTIYNPFASHDIYTIGSNGNIIASEMGNDSIIVSLGSVNDTIDTQAGGNDTINAGAGLGQILVAAFGDKTGHNLITLGAGNNEVRLGGPGFDTITAGSGNNLINEFYVNVISDPHSALLHDSITGGPNSFTLGAGNNTFVGSGFFTINDSLTAGNGNNNIDTQLSVGVIIKLGNGNNSLYLHGGHPGSSNPDQITVGSGNNTITGSQGSDIFTLGGGSNYIDAQGSLSETKIINIAGGSGSNTIIGGLGSNTINITGGSGHDMLYGNISNDTISTGSGFDIVDGKGGFNNITANGHSLVYIGTVALSADSIIGNANDTVSANYSAQAVKITLGAAGVSITHGISADSVTGVTNYILSQFNDTVTATSGAVEYSITAGPGNNSISFAGNTGEDTFGAGSGNSTATAGSGGNDFYAGYGSSVFNLGSGADEVYYNNYVLNANGTLKASGTNYPTTTVNNFVHGSDEIILDSTNLPAGTPAQIAALLQTAVLNNITYNAAGNIATITFGSAGHANTLVITGLHAHLVASDFEFMT